MSASAPNQIDLPTYVVRIYRRCGEGRRSRISGTVEFVPEGRVVAFGSVRQLTAILGLSEPPKAGASK